VYAQDPQIPSLQERRNVNVESCSFLKVSGNLESEENLDFDKSVKDHWSTSIQVDGILLHSRFLSRRIRILNTQLRILNGNIPIGKLRRF